MRDPWGLLTADERDRLAAGEQPREDDGFEDALLDRIEAIEGDAELLAEYDRELCQRLQTAIERALEAAEEDVNETPPTLGELEFPHEDEKCKAAAYAAREYIRASGGATRTEIIANVMPMYPLTTRVDEVLRNLDADETVEVPWWRDIVRPALEALPTIAAPTDGDESWTYRGST